MFLKWTQSAHCRLTQELYQFFYFSPKILSRGSINQKPLRSVMLYVHKATIGAHSQHKGCSEQALLPRRLSGRPAVLK